MNHPTSIFQLVGVHCMCWQPHGASSKGSWWFLAECNLVVLVYWGIGFQRPALIFWRRRSARQYALLYIHHIHIKIYIYMYDTSVHTNYTHTYMYIYTHIYLYKYISKHVYTPLTHTYMYIYIYIYRQIDVNIHGYTHKLIYIYI